ncbi:MFS transporter [Lysinibacillus sp. PLM2]|nr:MFS transporter [Lysinibacillus sp. PLM2]
MNKQESSYRWFVFGFVLITYFVIVSQRTAPGLITDQLMNDFQVSAAVIGLMTSIQFLAYVGLQIPVGLIADRYGPNRLLIFGTLLTGIGSLLYSFASNECILIFSRFLVGVGDSTIFINFVLILSQWFKSHDFVKMIGIVSMFAGLGSLTATLPYSIWISYVGWNSLFMTIGVLLVFNTFLLYFVLIKKPKKLFVELSSTSINLNQEKESVWKILQRVASTRQAWAAFLCHFGVVGTYVGFIGSWGVPFGIQVLELSRSMASQLIMYGLIGAIVGAPIISWIASRLGSIKIMYLIVHIVVVLSWLGMFLSGTSPSIVWIIVLFITIGFGNGASSLTFVVVRESFPAKEVGVVTGFANMGGFLSAVLLPIIFGKVLDLFSQEGIHFGYHYGLLIPAIFSAFGLIGALLLKKENIKEVINA